MNKCLIRVDGNSTIGTGHQMRCMAIAGELEKYFDVVFVAADEENSVLLSDRGYNVRTLKSCWNQMEGELEELQKVIQEEKARFILVDSYQVTEKYLAELKKMIRVVYVDDLHEFVYPCDVLINYAVYADKINYPEEYKGTGTKLLLGCKYAPLREEFKNILPKKTNKDVKKVLVLSGGTDQYHFLLQFVEQIVCSSLYSHIVFQVVCGKYNMDKERLREIEITQKNLEIYENLTNLQEYMTTADVAISAAGTTLYELAACGTATIAYALADNQIENLKGFSEKGYMLSVGDIRKGFSQNEIQNALKKNSNALYRAKVGRKMQELVDGAGTERLAKIVVEEILKRK